MEQQSSLGFIAITLLVTPFVLVLFIILYWRSQRKLKFIKSTLSGVQNDLSYLTTKSDKLKTAFDELSLEENRMRIENAGLTARFKNVTDLDAERASVAESIKDLEKQEFNLRSSFAEKKQIFDRLAKEVAIFDESIAFAELGIYKPHFDFSDSEAYKAAIEKARAEQKRLVSSKRAVICHETWSLSGSAAKGQTMVNRAINLTLRAFNSECDAAIANIRWNNASAMEKRLVRAFEQINKLNQSMLIEITDTYLKLRMKELHLTHEYREKLKAEREERAEMARAAREEQKLQRDLEKAEEEEARYAKLLAKARQEAESIVGPQLDAFNEQIRILERDLAEAHARVERAQAMAEKTRSGYVYIISNIGSFGDNVIKIGLTRRLDPTDRIRELGDASVPFLFDTHAIIYSDDAPKLERSLHGAFEPARINTQNYRKEFFRASIDDVEAAVKRLAPNSSFFRDIEAQEYRETLAKRNAQLAINEAEKHMAFPASL